MSLSSRKITPSVLTRSAISCTGRDYTPDGEMWNDRGNPEFWGIK